MQRVWRFPLEPVSAEHEDHVDPDETDGDTEERHGYSVDVEMPVGAEILTVKQSSRGLTVYALVDPEAETERRSFFVCGNGVDLPDGAGAVGYRGTYKRTGSVTLHVFELSKVPA